MQQSIQAVVQRAAQFLPVLVLSLFSAGQTENTQALPAPGQMADVICSADSTQSYSVYLPSNYIPAKHWPIIYFFDPGGRGSRPVGMYKALADTYGFIFAGSNNSKNFSGDQSAAVNAIWQDTHMRFSLDDHRVYTSGLSGGARVAGAMALNSAGQIAGVIAHGAGYPNGRPESGDKLLYYFSIGNQDFNWPEVINIGHDREKHGLPYRVRLFPGGHQWGPVDVMEDAIRWLQLKAMQAGTLAADPVFIDQQVQRLKMETEAAEKRNDALAQFDACRAEVDDLQGLRDVSAASTKLTSLKQSAALKNALKHEQEQISEQFKIEGEISAKLRAYEAGDVPDLNALRLEIVQAMSGLRQQAAHAKNEDRRLVLNRALDDIKVEGIENGQQEFQARHFDKAESCFDLMRQLTDDPWPALLLAETRVAMGNKKQAIKDLRDAVSRGLKDSDVILSDKRLDLLHAEPELQKLIVEMKSK